METCMNRRDFIRGLGAGLAAALMPGCKAGSKKNLNFVFFL
ncbi:MAG TPA: twin-arginine translocation signal domain-containing protein, partial [Phycisphaerales bacterium]|nr:twin-arginine translocation signal domain-containing protein [Phycisphaerales bacterium]